ncbi:hypothetical protein MTO96_028301 [Rhipicephalus appendiculatus]
MDAIPSVFPESESQLDTLPELSVSHDLQELLQDDDAVWDEHQERLLTQLRGTNLQLAGDGRCDSPGHSAKYLTYYFLCPDSGNIIHTEQVQVKESEQVKASATMEKEGLIRGLKFLSDHRMTVKSLTTDRHPGIKKYMRLQCPGICHYYDVWHVGKDSPAYKQIECIVTVPLLLKEIRQLSPSVQTYCLESFHSVLNGFAPKSNAFTYEGMRAWSLIAALHFNENSQREQARSSDGTEQWLIKTSKVEEKVPPAYSSEEGQKVPKEDLVAAQKARFLKF